MLPKDLVFLDEPLWLGCQDLVGISKREDQADTFALRAEFTDRQGVAVAVWDSTEVADSQEGHLTVPVLCLFLRGDPPTDNTGFARLDWAMAQRLRLEIEAFLERWSA